MEQLFNTLQEAIALGMPSLTLVDEDYGQLQTQEDTYPVTFPCVLINIEGIAWETLADDLQRGTATITLRLCMDCYHDTHYTSTTAHLVAERLAQSRVLHNIARGVELRHTTSLERTTSRWFSLPGAIKVYESSYECIIEDEPA